MAESAIDITKSSTSKNETATKLKIKKNKTATKVGIKTRYTSPHKTRHRASVVFSIILGLSFISSFDFKINPLFNFDY